MISGRSPDAARCVTRRSYFLSPTDFLIVSSRRWPVTTSISTANPSLCYQALFVVGRASYPPWVELGLTDY